MSTPTQDKLARHLSRVAELNRDVVQHDDTANRISALRLATFLAAVGATIAAFKGLGMWAWLCALTLAASFFAAVVWHAKVLARRRSVLARRAVHERHSARLGGDWTEFKYDGAGAVGQGHAYAVDIDLVGPGSLFQRIDVSHTVEGVESLARALAQPADALTIRARQLAVEELAQHSAFREELEVRATEQQDKPEKLNHAPFSALLRQPALVLGNPALRVASFALPVCTLFSYVLGSLELIPGYVMWLLIIVQAGLLWQLREQTHRTLNVITARLGFAEAYEGMLRLLEQTKLESPHLVALKSSMVIDGRIPSEQMARLRRYEGFAQLRTQGPVYLVLNLLTLWDLHCLERIERWIRDVGPSTERWFVGIGELEMLCSLATLRDGDPTTSFPVIVDDFDAGIACEALAHPLLKPEARVANDLTLEGAPAAAVVTGSNMAGKSTLLRALGLNVALALAGGPVCARAMRLPVVRIRASMRVEDSLQRGASYFHAELEKLKSIIADLERTPRVLFLLDELLRGTNARARSQGARAIVEHLLARRALGLVATHDVALADLEEKHPGRVFNCHFTDVFSDGEMRFDYVLRPGPVRTSNALRLLSMAGVDVPADERVA